MKQILIVGGGMTFDSYDQYLLYLKNKSIQLQNKKRRREHYLTEKMKGVAHIKNIEMPSKRNAQYLERAIIFSKFLNLIDTTTTTLIGSSLGGAFLVRYLSENNLTSIESVHLVAPPISNSLPGETLTNGFCIEHDQIATLDIYGSKLHFHHSLDDDVVPMSEMYLFQKLLPKANYSTYNNKNGHFQVEEFPELVELLKKNPST